MAECVTTVFRAIGCFLSTFVRCRGTAPNDDTTQEAEAIDGVGGKGVVLQEIVQSQDEIDAKKSRDEMDEMPKDEIDAEITEEVIGAQNSEDETDPRTAELNGTRSSSTSSYRRTLWRTPGKWTKIAKPLAILRSAIVHNARGSFIFPVHLWLHNVAFLLHVISFFPFFQFLLFNQALFY